MAIKHLLTAGLLLLAFGATAQVKIGNNPNTIGPSSLLELESTNRGLLPPRLTSAQRDAITSPPAGLMIYNTTTNCMNFFTGSTWNESCGTPSSSGGTAVVSGYTCSTGSTGALVAGTAASGVTQTITATVTTVGSYSITTTANGVTFAASGTFAATGAQNIVLNATGTPTAAGSNTFTINTTPNCNFSRTTAGAITSTTGRVWMDRNLGATRVAQTADDFQAYGDLYQWGRNADGHQLITWTSSTTGTRVNLNTTTLANADQAATPLFITINSGNNDWRGSTQNDNLWQGVAGINNPCPAGFRVPTNTEITAEVAAYNITSTTTAFSSPFRFTIPGFRNSVNGTLGGAGVDGSYWSSTVTGTGSFYWFFQASGVGSNISQRARGFSVRCIKN